MTLAEQIAAEEAAAASAQDVEAGDIGPAALAPDLINQLREYFAPQAQNRAGVAADQPRTTLYGSVDSAPANLELVLLGHLIGGDNSSEVYLNVTDPFCLISVGVQGAGKIATDELRAATLG